MMFPRLADLRYDNDLKQSDVAEYLCMNKEVYGRYERGEREIPAWAIIKLASLYKTSADYIMGLTDCLKPYPLSKIDR